MTGGWPSRDLLSHRRDATPTATAVIDAADGTDYTYRDLDDAVAATARRFAASLDADHGDGRPRVGIAAKPSPRFAVALFAVWRAGAIPVPLSPTQPVPDRRDRLDRLGLSLAIETGATAFDAVDPACPVVAVESPATTGAERDGGAQWHSDETALILFTSGTTGEPKGVCLTHGNLVASAVGSAFRLGVSPEDRWHACLPPNHMGGLAPLVRATLYGSAVVLQREFDAEETGATMSSFDATGVSVVPTMVRRLLDRDWTPHDALRVVLCGGAPTPPSLVEAADAAGVPLYPTYGTTETASQVATATPTETESAPGTVGSPLVTADVTIVDPDGGRPVDRDEVGELVVDGPVVTPGYLESGTPVGEFGLHTGDLASRDAAGRLEIHGRLDDAIQTGGETVHPARVAAAIRSLPAVGDAAVVGVADPEWGERVCALVVVESGHSVDLERLRRALADHLAPYELPRTVETAERIPRTESGTVDRPAVRTRFGDRRHDA